ncbi:MAG TPA: M48 family metallopeptidase, partial [Acidimicrobiales bacterium]|nr:M48 family metallopeptidase [Acidimicrobiales bacterium]
PARLAGAERAEMVQSLVGRVLAQRPHVRSSDEDLAARARHLARRYLRGTLPSSIRWVGNQQRRWGSCSPHSGEIRISDRLRVVPPWVLDAVLVHELAHLDEPSHSQRFYDLIARYPRTDEAAVFLEGFTLGLERQARQAEFALD